MEVLRSNIGTISGILIILGIFIVFVAVCCVKAPPDKAVIITGLWREPRILIGKVGTRIPVLERADTLCLKRIPITLYVKCLTADLDKITIKANIIVQISEDNILIAAKNFLNMPSNEIKDTLKCTLKGVIYESIKNMTLEKLMGTEIYSTENITLSNIQKSLGIIGMNVLSCHVLKISDKGIIKNMSAINAIEIKKKAAMAKIESEKDIKLAKAEAEIEAAIANVNALNTSIEICIYAITMLTNIKEMYAPVGEEGSLKDYNTERDEEATENSSRQRKYEANINHIGEMIAKDFAED